MQQGFAFLIPALAGVAIFFLILDRYDAVEQRLLRRYQHRLKWFAAMLDKLFLPHGQNHVYLLSYGPPIGLGLGSFSAIILLGGGLLPAAILGMVLGVLGWFAPVVLLTVLYKLRLKKFDEQLTDALNLMGSSLKAGLSFLQALQIMIDEIGAPLSQEFKLLLAEHRLGSSLEEAFNSLAARIPSRDLSIMVNSIVILRETGGDLTETFDTLYTTIMGRRKVEGKISALTSMGMAQGVTLSTLPIVLGLAFYMMQPETMIKMFTTLPGIGMTILALALIGVGMFAIIKVTRIDV